MFSRTTAIELMRLRAASADPIHVTEVGGVDGVQLPAGAILRDAELVGTNLVSLDVYISRAAMMGNHPEIDLAFTVKADASIGIEQ